MGTSSEPFKRPTDLVLYTVCLFHIRVRVRSNSAHLFLTRYRAIFTARNRQSISTAWRPRLMQAHITLRMHACPSRLRHIHAHTPHRPTDHTDRRCRSSSDNACLHRAFSLSQQVRHADHRHLRREQCKSRQLKLPQFHDRDAHHCISAKRRDVG